MIPLAMDNISNTRRKIRHQNSLRNGDLPPNKVTGVDVAEKKKSNGIYFLKSELGNGNWMSEEPENETFDG